MMARNIDGLVGDRLASSKIWGPDVLAIAIHFDQQLKSCQKKAGERVLADRNSRECKQTQNSKRNDKGNKQKPRGNKKAKCVGGGE